MLRVIIAAVLIYATWKLWKKASRGGRPQRTEANPQLAAEMIACRRCGTFVLNTESITRGGERFCSTECAAANDS